MKETDNKSLSIMKESIQFLTLYHIILIYKQLKIRYFQVYRRIRITFFKYVIHNLSFVT